MGVNRAAKGKPLPWISSELLRFIGLSNYLYLRSTILYARKADTLLSWSVFKAGFPIVPFSWMQG